MIEIEDFSAYLVCLSIFFTFIYSPICLLSCLSFFPYLFYRFLSIYLSVFPSIFILSGLAIYLSVYAPIYLSFLPSVCSICTYMYLAIFPSTCLYLLAYLPVYPIYFSIYLYVYLCICLFTRVCLPVCLSMSECSLVTRHQNKSFNVFALLSKLNLRWVHIHKTSQIYKLQRFW